MLRTGVQKQRILYNNTRKIPQRNLVSQHSTYTTSRSIHTSQHFAYISNTTDNENESYLKKLSMEYRIKTLPRYSRLMPPYDMQMNLSSPFGGQTIARSFSTSPNSNINTNTTIKSKSTHIANDTNAVALKKNIAAARRQRAAAQHKKLASALKKGGEEQSIIAEISDINQVNQQLPKVSEKAVSLVKRVPQMTVNGVKALGNALRILFTDPVALKAWLLKMKDKIKHEAKHYWLGTKLLYADVTTSTRILRRLLAGNALSRRERKQLQRTVADLLRLVPFLFFVIVPFMEFLLPVALKVFPNMLPSTYRDKFQREEDLKRQLKLRVSLAEFLQETVKEVIEDSRATGDLSEERKATATEVMDFIVRAQSGEPLTADETLRMAALFNDELMLDNISRPQLVAMCRYMGVQPYGNDNFLRFQLRNHVRKLKKDDQVIIWEGLSSLDKEELQSACMERGMRATGLTKAGYERQMRQWLDLSINKNVPTSLLIMSRALNITAQDTLEAALATSMSSLDEEVVTEVALAAGKEESSEVREMKLKNIRYQNEMIAEEEKERIDALSKKKAAEEEAAIAAAAASIKEEKEQKDLSLDEAAADMIQATKEDKAAKVVDEKKKSTSKSGAVLPKETLEAAARTIEHIVNLEELGALESLAFKSIVEKERQSIEQLKQSKHEMTVESLLVAGRIGFKPVENKTAGRMLNKLDSMLANLELDLEKVDKDVGDRLNILDKDSDGVLTAEELKHAIMTILRKVSTKEDADWLVNMVDQDQDGRISIEELMAWIAKCRELLEVTGEISLDNSTETKDAEVNSKHSSKKSSKQ